MVKVRDKVNPHSAQSYSHPIDITATVANTVNLFVSSKPGFVPESLNSYPGWRPIYNSLKQIVAFTTSVPKSWQIEWLPILANDAHVYFGEDQFDKADRVIICDHLKSGELIHQITGLPVIVCFHSRFIPELINELGDKRPQTKFIVVPKHDEASSEAASCAAQHENTQVLKPEKTLRMFSDSYSLFDLAMRFGYGVVHQLFKQDNAACGGGHE
ncbi:MAG: hypothetical protein Sw2PiBPW_39850 [Shewanella algae]